MGLAQLVKAHYSNKNLPIDSRQIVLPDETTAIGATVTVGGALTYGAWVDLALAAAVTADTLVVGVVIDTPSASMVATEITTIDIGSTWSLGTNYADAATLNAISAAVIAGAHRAEIRLEFSSDAGVFMPVMLPFPVWIPYNSGILARVYDVDDTGAHDSCNVSAICVQLFK